MSEHFRDEDGYNVVIEDIPVRAEAVKHPQHYGHGRYEVIKVIDAWALNFSRGNAVKYIARAGKKDPNAEIEDLEKAVFYLKHEIKLLKAKKAEE